MAETIFSYRAFDGAGSLRSGTIAAEDADAVTERIRRMGLRPISVERKAGGALNRSINVPGMEKRVKPGDLAVIDRQLATMIGSGLPMMRCLSALQAQAGHPTVAKAITAIREDVQNGDSLSSAVAKHPKTFDEFSVSMIQAGESTGKLDEALFQLADSLERTAAIRRKVRSAMTYPIAIASLAGLIVTAMLVFLVPTFERIFADLEGQLPLPTRIVIGSSRFLTGNLVPVALAVVLAVVGLRLAVRTERGRFAWDTTKLRLPVLGPLLLRSSISRFCRSLSVLLHSGTTILEALDIAARTVPNMVVRRAVREMEVEVRNGRGIGACMAEHAVFPAMLVQMVEVGEESGRIDELLEKAAVYYESRVQAAVDGITSLIEPALLVFMGITVGGMVVSLYLPMFQVINLVQ